MLFFVPADENGICMTCSVVCMRDEGNESTTIMCSKSIEINPPPPLLHSGFPHQLRHGFLPFQVIFLLTLCATACNKASEVRSTYANKRLEMQEIVSLYRKAACMFPLSICPFHFYPQT